MNDQRVIHCDDSSWESNRMSSTLSPRVILQTALEQYDEAEWHDTLLASEETHHDEFHAALKVVEAVRAVLAEPAAAPVEPKVKP